MISPTVAGAMHPAGWDDLAAELDCWAGAGHRARFWWRDDDAVAATPQLDALLALADGVPLTLAVVPADAGPALAAAVSACPNVTVAPHGWRHVNHGGDGRKSEYPAGRLAAEVAAELAWGRERLAALFGMPVTPVMVPPWNRFAAEFAGLLAEAGIAGLSQMAPRRGPPLPAGVAALDVHLDVVAWRAGRGFVGTGQALGRLVAELRERRSGGDPWAPIGVLTHHLVTDPDTSAFLARLMATIAAHPAAGWVSLAGLMPPR